MAYKFKIDEAQTAAGSYRIAYVDADNGNVVDAYYFPVNGCTLRGMNLEPAAPEPHTVDLGGNRGQIAVASWAKTARNEPSVMIMQNGNRLLTFDISEVDGYGTTYADANAVMAQLTSKLYA